MVFPVSWLLISSVDMLQVMYGGCPLEHNSLIIDLTQAITRSRAANSKKEVETKANQQTTTTTSECFNVCHQKYF